MTIGKGRDRPRSHWGAVLGIAVVVGLSAALVPFRSDISRASPALALVVPIVVAGLVGGRTAALLVAVGAALAFNLAFIPPHWTLKVNALDDTVALGVFGLVAGVIGTLVAHEGERRQSAEERAAELQLLNDELRVVERERERLAEEATRAAVLERVDEQRAALLRSVSHDLRTPLATVRAVVSDLLGDAPYDDATRADLLGLVSDEAERLDRLVANLLSMSRIEAGDLRPARQAVDLGELVAERVRYLRRVLRDVRVQLEVPDDLPLVNGDYTQLEQVVTNLLENAARHAPPASMVRVTATSRADRIEVAVSDEGIGVPDYEQSRIFEPFRRGEGSASTGIGLAICKAVVDAHGGAIEVRRTPGGGATFAFTVPVHSG